MADIRINALATTAASTASDDFVAVDGSANGTRKLNAYSPTFGGNLTVSGNIGLGSAASSWGGGAKAIQGQNGSLAFYDGATDQLWLSQNAYWDGSWKYIANGFASSLQQYNGELYFYSAGSGSSGGSITLSEKLKLDASGNTTLAGNLTVSGTGTSSVAGDLNVGSSSGNTFSGWFKGAGGTNFVAIGNVVGGSQGIPSVNAYTSGFAGTTALGLNPNGGNVLIGTTTDSANGKLQLVTHTTSAGGIGFGTDTSLYRVRAGTLGLNDASGGTNPRLELFETGTIKGSVQTYTGAMYVGTEAAGGVLYLRSGAATTALTLDSSQNATFAGKVAASVASGGTTALYGKATITSTSADNAIVWLGIGDQNSATRAGLVAYQSWNGTYTDYLAKITVLQGGVGGIDALTFGNTGNATFAGKITANGAGSTFKGTATNDSAAAGYMGEYAETSTVYASRITLTTDTVANVASVSLTAGDWDVSGNVELEMSGVTSTDKRSGVSTTSASLTNNPDTCGVIDLPTTTLTGYLTIPTPTVRISIASTTTVYLPTKVTFSAGTTKAWGIIRARRVR